MDTKTIFVLTFAFAVSLCRAQENIFGVETGKVISETKMFRHFTQEYKPDVKEVARLLAQAEDKTVTLGGPKVSDLVAMAEINPDCPLCKCKESIIFGYKKNCQYVAQLGNVYLNDYCETCVKEQFNRCANADKEKLFDYVLDITDGKQLLLTFVQKLSHYIQRDGEEHYPTIKNVAGLFKSYSIKEKKKLKVACNNLQINITKELFYFDPAGEKTFFHLREHQPEKHLLRTGCDAVRELLANQ